MLSIYDWIYGSAQIGVGFLAIFAGVICALMISSTRVRHLRAWRPLLIALILFVVQQLIGGFRTFGILPSTGVFSFLVHVVVGGILAAFIVALVIQLQVNRGWLR